MRTNILIGAVIGSILLLIASCGDNGTGPSGDAGYYPNNEGSTWTYKVTDNSATLATWDKTETVKGTRDVNGVTCQVIEITNTAEPNKTSRTFFNDNDTNQVDVWAFETLTGGVVENYYSLGQGLPTLKYPCDVGAKWTVYVATGLKPTEIPFIQFDDDDFDDDGIDDTADVTITAEVRDQEDITVAAGTFEDCYEIVYPYNITVHLSSYGSWTIIVTSNQWFKPYVGTVKRHTVVDMPYPAPDEVFTEELTSYNLPS